MPKQELKRRKYYGMYYWIPADTKFMAIDEDGYVWCYTDKPTLGLIIAAWMGDQDGMHYIITRPFNWRKSLRPV